jgi:hypothetical protein
MHAEPNRARAGRYQGRPDELTGVGNDSGTVLEYLESYLTTRDRNLHAPSWREDKLKEMVRYRRPRRRAEIGDGPLKPGNYGEWVCRIATQREHV